VEVHDLAGDFLDVGDAEEAEGNLRDGIVGAGLRGGADEDVAGAVGALTVIHGNDVGGSAGLDGAAATAGDDQDALIGDGVDGAQSLEIDPQGSQDDAKADEEEGNSEQRKDAERVSERIAGFGKALGAVVGGGNPKKREAGEGNAE
jgi:hypothetical protein